MKETLRRFTRATPLYYSARNWWHWANQRRDLKRWESGGCPAPPPDVVKQRVLREYAEKYDLHIFVETGTCRGDMVEAMKSIFDEIYSIELSATLFEESRRRFRSARHIRILQGDSGTVLREVIKQIERPALFWLDSHYSGDGTARGSNDTPIYDELRHILNTQSKGHIIIIDDARCFGTDPAYPTVEELKQFVFSQNAIVQIGIATDSIRITPGG